MPLPLDDIREYAGRLWSLHQQELSEFNRLHDYAHGLLGQPSLPEEADEEVKALARLAIRNVLGLVRDSFCQNLSAVGYRTATSKNNLPAWANWQRNRMDARQAEIYRPALTYGVAYVCVTPSKDGPVFRPRSPRKIISTYADPQVDQWPQFALETWTDRSDGRPTRRGLFYDDEYIYPLNLGPELPAVSNDTVQSSTAVRNFPVQILDDDQPPIPHRAGVCPVVRYVNARDADDLIIGEIAPLITLQRAINEANFDQLVVARFGAFPQKVVTGWSGSRSEVLEASARRVWAFDDPDVKAFTLQPASLGDYGNLIEALMQHVAMVAQISPSQVTGKMVQVSADALAAAEAQEQRKLQAKRDSFGESHEQLLQLAGRMSGDASTADDVEAEIQWRVTEARSFAATVDGVVKLSQIGIPVSFLLPMIPGMTQQQMVGIEQAMAAQQSAQQITDLVSSLRAGAAPAVPVEKPAGVPGRQPVAPPVVA